MRLRPAALTLAAACLALAAPTVARASTLPAGTPDPTWGTNGTSITDLGSHWSPADASAGSGVALPDGRLLVIGRRANDATDGPFALRLTATGTPDPTFGTSGTTDLSAIGAWVEPTGVAIDAGKVYIAGTVSSDGSTDTPQPFIARLTDDGHLDPTFGAGAGFRTYPIPGGAQPAPGGGPIPLQVGGLAAAADGSLAITEIGVRQGWVLRLHADGATIPTFGDQGLARVTLPGFGDVILTTGIGITSDDDVLVGGRTGDSNIIGFVARLDTTGALDASYGTGGFATAQQPATFGTAAVYSLGVDAMGRASLLTIASRTISAHAYTVSRFLSDGSADPSFGTGGMVEPTLGNSDTFEPQTLSVAADGTTVAMGQRYHDLAWTSGLVRFNSDGTTDVDFAANATLPAETTSSFGSVRTIIAPDGSVFALGVSGQGVAATKFLGTARTIPDPTPTPLPTPTPPQIRSPLVRPATLTSALSKLLRRKAHVTTSCSTACAVSLTLTVSGANAVKAKLERKPKSHQIAKAITLAKVTGRLAKAGTLTLTPKLSLASIKALRHTKRLPITTTIVATDTASGRAFTTTKSLTLRS